jgi:predicted Zn finger-like uncharacterized protein
MDVRCERCRAQYVFDDEQVTPTGLTVQCTNCGHVFKVKKKELVVTVPVKPDEMDGAPIPATAAAPRPGGTPASVPAPAAGPPAAHPAPPAAERPREWRVRQANGNTFTFRELTTLQKWIIEQKVSRDDEISHSGDQWKRLGNIAELASFFQVVEAAERSRAQAAPPAVTPLPMPAMPVYGVTIQTPLYPAPPPPSGFPPPAYAVPSPPPAPEYRAEPTPILPPPVHEVDLGPDVETAPRRRRGRAWALTLVLLGAAGAAGWVYVPPLLAPPPAPPAEIAVPITIQMRAEPAPAAEPPPPEPAADPPAAPVPAPEPVIEPALQSPPEPVKVAKGAPKGPKALLAQAQRLLAKGDAEGALELFGRVAAQDPENAEALAGRGLCYLDLESYAPAEASFLAALRIDPGEADALLGLAETYRYQGKKMEAVSHYERYLAEHPDGEEAEVARNALSELRK